jgi:organic hydroperoxide reductase OsmC/OhrA
MQSRINVMLEASRIQEKAARQIREVSSTMLPGTKTEPLRTSVEAQKLKRKRPKALMQMLDAVCTMSEAVFSKPWSFAADAERMKIDVFTSACDAR